MLFSLQLRQSKIEHKRIYTRNNSVSPISIVLKDRVIIDLFLHKKKGSKTIAQLRTSVVYSPFLIFWENANFGCYTVLLIGEVLRSIRTLQYNNLIIEKNRVKSNYIVFRSCLTRKIVVYWHYFARLIHIFLEYTKSGCSKLFTKIHTFQKMSNFFGQMSPEAKWETPHQKRCI